MNKMNDKSKWTKWTLVLVEAEPLIEEGRCKGTKFNMELST